MTAIYKWLTEILVLMLLLYIYLKKIAKALAIVNTHNLLLLSPQSFLVSIAYIHVAMDMRRWTTAYACDSHNKIGQKAIFIAPNIDQVKI